MDLKNTYNKIAGDWFKEHREEAWWTEGADKFISFLDKDAQVLDVGCGAGIKSKYLANKGRRVTGIDFSEKMIEIAKREAPSAKFFVMDIKNLDSLKKTFDGIFACAVLLHIPKSEVKSVLIKLKDSLKGGGYLYVAVKEARAGTKNEGVVVEKSYGYTYERFFSYFALSEVKEQLLSLGMKICYEDVTSFGKTNWVQVICRK